MKKLVANIFNIGIPNVNGAVFSKESLEKMVKSYSGTKFPIINTCNGVSKSTEVKLDLSIEDNCVSASIMDVDIPASLIDKLLMPTVTVSTPVDKLRANIETLDKLEIADGLSVDLGTDNKLYSIGIKNND